MRLCLSVASISPAPPPRGGIVVAHGPRRGVDPDLAAALGVLQLDDAHVGKLRLAGIVDADAHQVVLAPGDLQRVVQRRLVAGRVHEVREDEGRAALLVDIRQETHRLREFRARGFGAEADQFADDHQNMVAALLRGMNFSIRSEKKMQPTLSLFCAAEKASTAAISVMMFFFQPVGRTEHARGRHVDQQHHRQFAFLLVDLDVGFARAGRDVPVDVPHVVARTVLPHFGKRHAPPAESRMVLSGEDLVGKTAGLDLDLADAFENIVLGFLHR